MRPICVTPNNLEIVGTKFNIGKNPNNKIIKIKCARLNLTNGLNMLPSFITSLSTAICEKINPRKTTVLFIAVDDIPIRFNI